MSMFAHIILYSRWNDIRGTINRDKTYVLKSLFTPRVFTNSLLYVGRVYVCVFISLIFFVYLLKEWKSPCISCYYYSWDLHRIVIHMGCSWILFKSKSDVWYCFIHTKKKINTKFWMSWDGIEKLAIILNKEQIFFY